MASTIQHRRGQKETLPRLTTAELGFCEDTKELFIGGKDGNVPILTLEEDVGGPLAFDAEATEGSKNLITSGAVFEAISSGGGGATFIPSVSSDGTLSWTNDGGLDNPDPVNIMGPQGEQGEQGPQGERGVRGESGERGDTGPAGSDGVSCTHSWSGTTLTITSASGTSSANRKGEKGDTGPQGPAGPAGEGGGDMLASVYDPLGRAQDVFAYADSSDIDCGTF